jgi:uncharacterized protein YcfJ
MRHLKTLSGIALTFLLASTGAVAGERYYDDDDYYDGDGYYVNAKVVNVEPVFRRVRIAEPQQMCWSEPTHYRGPSRGHRNNAAASTIIGGVVGGVVGNQVGRRNDHRSELTVAGALVGAAIGHSVGKSQHSRRYRSNRYSYQEPYCETRTEYRYVEQIAGYDVTYRYQGRYFTTRTDHEPGKRIRVRVDLEPATRHSGYSESRHGNPSYDHYCDDDCA